MTEDEEDRYAGLGQDTWRVVISRRIEQIDALKAQTSAYIHSMSTWMIAQLFIANAGGLTIETEAASKTALSCFAVGILLAMLCALAAWGQSHVSFHILNHHGNPNSLAGLDHLPVAETGLEKWERRLFRGTLVAGILSLLAFSVGVTLRIWAGH